MRIVPALDELEGGQLGFGLRLKAPPVQQLAFEGGEEALALRVVELVFSLAITESVNIETLWVFSTL